MSFLNAEEPSACDLVTDFGIDGVWHPSLGMEMGDNVKKIFHDIADGTRPLDIWVKEISARAGAIVALGDCACWGGIPATAPNPVDNLGLQYLKRSHGGFVGVDFKSQWGLPVINIPGCPAHPDWISPTRTMRDRTGGMDVAFQLRGVPEVIHTHAFRWDHGLAFGRWLLKDEYPKNVTVYLIEDVNFGFGEPVVGASRRVDEGPGQQADGWAKHAVGSGIEAFLSGNTCRWILGRGYTKRFGVTLTTRYGSRYRYDHDPSGGGLKSAGGRRKGPLGGLCRSFLLAQEQRRRRLQSTGERTAADPGLRHKA